MPEGVGPHLHPLHLPPLPSGPQDNMESSPGISGPAALSPKGTGEMGAAPWTSGGLCSAHGLWSRCPESGSGSGSTHPGDQVWALVITPRPFRSWEGHSFIQDVVASQASLLAWRFPWRGRVRHPRAACMWGWESRALGSRVLHGSSQGWTVPCRRRVLSSIRTIRSA